MQKISFGEPHHHVAECASTNLLAMEWAKAGAAEGTLISTDFQTQGRGRLGREWNASANDNLLFSLILRPQFAPEKWGLIILSAALAMAKMLEQELHNATQKVQIKWSNDILLNRKKVCGMLLESSIGKENVVILGIGLNVNQAYFPPELAQKASSLFLQTRSLHDKNALLARFLTQFYQEYISLQQGSENHILHEYLLYLAGLNESIKVHELAQNTFTEGVIRGVDANGALILELPNGTRRTFYSGEVSLQSSYL